MNMEREEVKKTLKILALSQGSYGRLLRDLEEAEQLDPETADAFYESLLPCRDAIDVINTIEG